MVQNLDVFLVWVACGVTTYFGLIKPVLESSKLNHLWTTSHTTMMVPIVRLKMRKNSKAKILVIKETLSRVLIRIIKFLKTASVNSIRMLFFPIAIISGVLWLTFLGIFVISYSIVTHKKEVH